MTTRHRLQTSIEVAPSHWVVARPNRGVWSVVEITAQASCTHSHHRRREHAELLAAAVAATRTHHTLTAEDNR